MSSKKQHSENLSIAVIGSGPAGLMAADVAARAGANVTIFEKRKSLGRKLLVAGSSGLNVTYEAKAGEFETYYSAPEFMRSFLDAFSPKDWIEFIGELGLKVFLGTSKRYLLEEKKAALFLRAWESRLQNLGVEFAYDFECTNFEVANDKVTLDFRQQKSKSFHAVIFALGGASWEQKPVEWPDIFAKKNIDIVPFEPTNVGYEVQWPSEFLEEAGLRKQHQPLKNVTVTSSKGSKRGDLMLTEFGIEGTPIYHVGPSHRQLPEAISIDLRPDLSLEELSTRLGSIKENLAPIRRIKKTLGLDALSDALLFHLSDRGKTLSTELHEIAQRLKALNITLLAKRPMSEAISSGGGISRNELTSTLELRKHPRVFVAGEMIDWDAPTGGFLIQGCVSQGFVAATAAVER